MKHFFTLAMALGLFFCPVSHAQDPVAVVQQSNSQPSHALVVPPLLKEGDKVAIVASSTKVSEDDVKPTFELLEEWGLEAVYDSTLFSTDFRFAGTVQQRIQNVQRVLDDPDIKAVWFARGGYGAVNLIDSFDLTQFMLHPKWLVGYSDITAFHSLFNINGVATLHATMPINIDSSCHSDTTALATLWRALFEGTVEYCVAPDSLNRLGVVEGEIVGGNLMLLTSQMGTPTDINTDGKILFIEEVGESLYRIDRMMKQLKRGGRLSHLKGLVVGGMTNITDGSNPYGRTVEQIIKDAVSEYDYPVCFHLPFGHVGMDNSALPLGEVVRLEVTESGTTLSNKLTQESR